MLQLFMLKKTITEFAREDKSINILKHSDFSETSESLSKNYLLEMNSKNTHYERNKEKLLEQAKEYYENNKEKIKEEAK